MSGRIADEGRDWIAEFIAGISRENRLGPRTIEAYTLDLRMLFRWAAARGKELTSLSTSEIVDYLADRRASGARPATIARYLSSYRRFYGYLMDAAIVDSNPVGPIEKVPVLKEPHLLLSDEVVRKLLRPVKAGDEPGAGAYRAARDHALVCMLHGTTLSISAVRQLRWDQVDAKHCLLRVNSRNGASRTYRLPENVLSALVALHGQAASSGLMRPGNPWCFPTISGRPMTRQGLGHVMRRRAQEAAVHETVTPSAIRQAGLAAAAAGSHHHLHVVSLLSQEKGTTP